jgi:hypothetical protein
VHACGKMVLLHKLLPKLRAEGHKVRRLGRQRVGLGGPPLADGCGLRGKRLCLCVPTRTCQPPLYAVMCCTRAASCTCVNMLPFCFALGHSRCLGLCLLTSTSICARCLYLDICPICTRISSIVLICLRCSSSASSR